MKDTDVIFPQDFSQKINLHLAFTVKAIQTMTSKFTFLNFEIMLSG
jgi:hypothetical protein